jgi:steroid delta-isomerase-like uncharacterized protein
MTDALTDILHHYYAAWSRQEPDSVMGFFTEVSTFEDLAFEVKFQGLAQIRSFVDLTYTGAPDFRVAPETIISNGISAAATWTMSGTHDGDLPGLPATGKRFDVRATSIVWFRDERIERIVDYWNPDAFRRCVGLI